MCLVKFEHTVCSALHGLLKRPQRCCSASSTAGTPLPLQSSCLVLLWLQSTSLPQRWGYEDDAIPSNEQKRYTPLL